MAPLPTPFAGSKFSLNSAGVAGFFGGKEAIAAMATVHLYADRRWLGWFNSPGSYTIAKRFGRMANGPFWDGLFPGPNDSPAVTFGLDGKKGPKYIAALSGTTIVETGHLAYLTIEESRNRDQKETTEIAGRKTMPVGVSYLAMKPVSGDAAIQVLPVWGALLGLIPIFVSVATCVMCAVVSDWYSFSMILLGIISSGLASVFIGEGRLVVNFGGKPAEGAPPGHGLLVGEDEIVVIKGREKDVNAITKGRFDLETSTKEPHDKGKVDEKKDAKPKPQPERKSSLKWYGHHKKGVEGSYHAIGVCSLLLIVQFLLQLLLIPQGSLFGQIMFLISLGVSWGYNSYLSSLEKERIQTNLLFQKLGEPEMHRFSVGTRTTMAVFACLLLFHGVTCPYPEDNRTVRLRILRSCLPNDTRMWSIWMEKVVTQLLSINESESLHHLVVNEEDRQRLIKPDRDLLETLLEDAKAAFKGYLIVRSSLPGDSSDPTPPPPSPPPPPPPPRTKTSRVYSCICTDVINLT